MAIAGVRGVALDHCAGAAQQLGVPVGGPLGCRRGWRRPLRRPSRCRRTPTKPGTRLDAVARGDEVEPALAVLGELGDLGAGVEGEADTGIALGRADRDDVVEAGGEGDVGDGDGSIGAVAGCGNHRNAFRGEEIDRVLVVGPQVDRIFVGGRADGRITAEAEVHRRDVEAAAGQYEHVIKGREHIGRADSPAVLHHANRNQACARSDTFEAGQCRRDDSCHVSAMGAISGWDRARH